MNGGIVPLLLLGTSFGLSLSFVPWFAAWRGLLAFVLSSAAGLGISVPTGLTDAFFAGLLLSTIAIAGLAYLPIARTTPRILMAGLYAGFWMGAYASISNSRAQLVFALLSVLVFLPGKWCTSRGYPIVIQVVASWMIAIASLSLFVSLVPTPGYKPDHME